MHMAPIHLPLTWLPSSGVRPCLLYTSDAADERSSVDLGGRRIIKKKKSVALGVRHDSAERTAQNKEMPGRREEGKV